MTWNLFLDDVRNPQSGWKTREPDDWVVARSCKEAEALVSERGVPQAMSLDHNLGLGPSQDGPAFLWWLIVSHQRRDFDASKIEAFFHSASLVDRHNMQILWTNFLKSLEA